MRTHRKRISCRYDHYAWATDGMAREPLLSDSWSSGCRVSRQIEERYLSRSFRLGTSVIFREHSWQFQWKEYRGYVRITNGVRNGIFQSSQNLGHITIERLLLLLMFRRLFLLIGGVVRIGDWMRRITRSFWIPTRFHLNRPRLTMWSEAIASSSWTTGNLLSLLFFQFFERIIMKTCWFSRGWTNTIIFGDCASSWLDDGDCGSSSFSMGGNFGTTRDWSWLVYLLVVMECGAIISHPLWVCDGVGSQNITEQRFLLIFLEITCPVVGSYEHDHEPITDSNPFVWTI